MAVEVSHVTINLLHTPRAGDTMLTPRMSKEHVEMITQAAAVVNMSQSAFMRTVLFAAAKEVLKHAP